MLKAIESTECVGDSEKARLGNTTFLELTFPNSGCRGAATLWLFRSETRVNFAFWLAHPTLIPSTFQLFILGTSSADEFLAHTDRFPSEKCSRSSQSFVCCVHETRLRVAHFPFRQLNRRGRIQGGPAELYELFGASDGNQLACSPSARASHRNRV